MRRSSLDLLDRKFGNDHQITKSQSRRQREEGEVKQVVGEAVDGAEENEEKVFGCTFSGPRSASIIGVMMGNGSTV